MFVYPGSCCSSVERCYTHELCSNRERNQWARSKGKLFRQHWVDNGRRPCLLPCRPLPTQLFQARDGTLAVEDMDGGTFTISNGGVFGSLYGTPIINPPQSAILGMHGVFDRPVAINKQVRPQVVLLFLVPRPHGFGNFQIIGILSIVCILHAQSSAKIF